MVMKAVLVAGVLGASVGGAAAQACKPFKDIYKDGKELCEGLWNDAFVYVPKDSPDYDLAYTMWFFDDENPNNGVTDRRVQAGLHPQHNDTESCHASYFHHEKPQRENNEFTECHPWRNEACCKAETVDSHETIKALYGDEYAWDNCGPISQECYRFFVQENCFYECDVNLGLFRKFSPHLPTNKINNTWEIFGMPIKGEYCDAFFHACAEELFCDSGDVFKCADEARSRMPLALPVGAIVAIVVLSVLVCILSCFTYRAMRQRPLHYDDKDSGMGGSGMGGDGIAMQRQQEHQSQSVAQA